MKDFRTIHHKKLRVAFENQFFECYEINGRIAQALLYLVNNPGGVTGFELTGWFFRLAARIHDLRKKYNLDIVAKDAYHDGAVHARYFLNTPVRIIKVEERNIWQQGKLL